MLHAKRVQEAMFLRAAGGRIDLGAQPLRDLHRGQADAAGRGVNQHALAFATGCARSNSAYSAVRNAIGSAAACSKVNSAGLRTARRAGVVT